jgi:hypothetical protein
MYLGKQWQHATAQITAMHGTVKGKGKAVPLQA